MVLEDHLHRLPPLLVFVALLAFSRTLPPPLHRASPSDLLRRDSYNNTSLNNNNNECNKSEPEREEKEEREKECLVLIQHHRSCLFTRRTRETSVASY